MTIIGKNNDPPLTVEPFESTECNSDICGFPSYEEMVIGFVNTQQRINGGIDFQIGVVGKQLAMELSVWYNSTAFNRNPFIPFDPDQRVPYDNSVSIQRAVDEALSMYIHNILTFI